MPTLGLVVNSYLRERVYTFPEAVDLGTLQWADVERSPDLLDRTAQTLMVYQVGGHDLAASFGSDIPGLAIAAARGPRGDRWQAVLKLDRAAVVPGVIRGALRIDTNDPDFPRLVIPVRGEIVGAPEPASAPSPPRGGGGRHGGSSGGADGASRRPQRGVD